MSVVTNLLLSWGPGDDGENLELVNRFFDGRGLVSVKDQSLPPRWYGGVKTLTCGLALGAFKTVDLEGLISHLRSLRWRDPHDVQLIVKEEGLPFRVIDVFPEAPAPP